jgi:predicted Zn-dependent peptidase
MTSIIKVSSDTPIVHIPSNIGIGLLGFTFPIGSDYESQGECGISHLMEHLMCKSFDDLLPKMHRLGINYNAYTSSDQILFYFSGIEEYLDQLSTILYDRITSCSFVWTEEAFDIEKKTVIQEYEDSFNEQTSGVLQGSIIKIMDLLDYDLILRPLHINNH